MPYRNPNQPRIQAQAATVLQYAGQTATWRQYVSAETGVVVAGRGATRYYREQTVTALFAPLPHNNETQTDAGMLASDMFQATTRERIGRQDELKWGGETYRVESDPSPATMPGYFVATVKRGFAT